MYHFTPWASLFGGLILGIGALVLFAGAGRIAGMSGIALGAIVGPRGERAWRWWFVGGLLVGAIGWLALKPSVFGQSVASTPKLAIAGLLVGLGTQWSNGCTSGHGVCGLSRRSPRSLAAVATFMLTAAVAVYVSRSLGVSAS
jgi:uncharacterized membrane protein YedE/YeeE